MATEKPRFSITIEPRMLEQVEEFQYENKMKSQSRAIIELVRRGLAEMDPNDESGKVVELPPSSAALQLAKDFEKLDSHGKAVLRAIADEELNRMEQLAELAMMDPAVQEPKIINLFNDPSAAGIAAAITSNDCQPYELKPEDPQGAAYAVRLQGDSMAPYCPDGSIVFVNHDQMRDGDIGIFCVDGATVCKQWHHDKVLGMTYLFSLNRDRADADLVITPSSGRSLVWQGRVITKRRYDLPGM